MADASPAPLRVLLLCHAFNSLSQRLWCELRALGHDVSVELDIADEVTAQAIELFEPDFVLAPFLKRRIPPSIWQRTPCLVVHPGPLGDRGPSALDWAVRDGHAEWGVTVLQADGDYDAGPVRASAAFAMRQAGKGSLYRREACEAAVRCLHQILGERAWRREGPGASASAASHVWRPAMRQADRRIDWATATTAEALAKLRSADGQPGVQDELLGLPCRLFDPHAASDALIAELPAGPPGAAIGRRDEALLRRTRDGAVWIGQASCVAACGDGPAFRLPCSLAFGAAFDALPELPVPLQRADDEWGEIRYREVGPPQARVGMLSFDFCNGAMSTAQCRRLLAAIEHARLRDTRVLMLLGGEDFFSNGIHLHCIEAAAHRPGDSGADESLRNIEAIDDVALAIITTTDRLTVAVLRGNAGAGGAFLALAADEVWAHRGVVMNPHYRNMGNLYGSEYWTYLLPRRLGEAKAADVMGQRLPIRAADAARQGLIDRCFDVPAASFERAATEQALAMAASHNAADRIATKQARRHADEAARPLAAYRQHELSRMHANFYGFDPSYHVARYHFVHKLAHAWTPRHLALHRELAPRGRRRPA